MKMFPHFSLVTALSLLIAGPALGQSIKTSATGIEATRTIRVLPQEISRSLKIMRTPTSQPVPFLIGTYWSCSDTPIGTEICHLVLVVCRDDQSLCTEV